MESTVQKNFIYGLDVLRLLSCAAILFYHMGFLPGGYLAVCVFFVLSAYLSCVSAFKKDRFSWKDYYVGKFMRLYLPLLFVVLITVGALSLFENLRWGSLKPETTSVLLGYNNFWQIKMNSDYFTRQISTPFLHLWYIAILMQFDLVFPFLYLGLRKAGEALGEKKLCGILTGVTAALTVYFLVMALTHPILRVYYGTDTRLFSLFFGVTIGFCHGYGFSLIGRDFNAREVARPLFAAYCILCVLMFIFVSAEGPGWIIGMVLCSLAACRIISWARQDTAESKTAGILHRCCGPTYEIYLWQYPVIYLFQRLGLRGFWWSCVLIAAVIVLSVVLHRCMNWFSEGDRFEPKKLAVGTFSILLALFVCFGGYQYLSASSNTEEINALKEQMAQNQTMMEQKQQEYREKQAQLQEKQQELEQKLQNLENIQVVGIGDSVMLGAVDQLYTKFPDSYFDAEISRTAYVVPGILQSLNEQGIGGEAVILALGANGDCTDDVRNQIIELCGDREVFWMTVTNDSSVNVNHTMWEYAEKVANFHVIDWATYSQGHPEYFGGDGLHLTEEGKIAYSECVYQTVVETMKAVYQSEYDEQVTQLQQGSA